MSELEENEDLDFLYYQEIIDDSDVRTSREEGNVGCFTVLILFFIIGVIIL